METTPIGIRGLSSYHTFPRSVFTAIKFVSRGLFGCISWKMPKHSIFFSIFSLEEIIFHDTTCFGLLFPFPTSRKTISPCFIFHEEYPQVKQIQGKLFSF